MRGEGRFERIFLPWMAHPGRPEDFRQRMVDSGMDWDAVIEHYPETEQEAIMSAMGSFFGKALEKHIYYKEGDKGYLIRGETGNPTFYLDRHGMLEVWEQPQTGWKGKYAIGSDVGEGLGQDSSVAYVIDRTEGRLVARMRTNRVDAHQWGDHLNDLSQFYGGALVCCERNGSGITTIKRLEELNAPQYVRISAGKTAGMIQREFGWATTQSSKYELCGDLKAWLTNTPESVPCGVLADECSTFIRNETGRLGAENGKNDDCVIAAALTIQADKFMQEAKAESGVTQEMGAMTIEYIAQQDLSEALKAAQMDENAWDW